MPLFRAWAGTVGSVCLLLAVLLSPPAAQAENPDYDLKLIGISADEPLQRSCGNALSATLVVNGIKDIDLPSGSAEIRFAYEEPGGNWNQIGVLTVTFDPATDGLFAPGETWPTDFPSTGDAAVQWRAPAGLPDSVNLRAEVVYTAPGISDEHPEDNAMTAVFETEPATCSTGGGRDDGCFYSAAFNKPFCIRSPDDFIDPARVKWEIERIKCLANPECRPRIPFCRVVDCNPCLSGLSCPPDRSFDVLIEEPRDFLQVDLLGRGGERIARARALEEPVTQGDRTFRQMLSFKAEKGVQYRLEIRPGRASEEFAEKMGETMPLNFALRTEKGLVSPERRRFDFLNRGQLDIRRDLRGLRVKPEFDQ